MPVFDATHEEARATLRIDETIAVDLQSDELIVDLRAAQNARTRRSVLRAREKDCLDAARRDFALEAALGMAERVFASQRGNTAQ